MAIFYYLLPILLISSCSNNNNKKTMIENQQWTRNLAVDYFEAYAIFEKKKFTNCIKINTDNRLRAKIGAAEFEYMDSLKIFIVRGLINNDLFRSDPKFKEAMIEKIKETNQNPPKKFKGAYL